MDAELRVQENDNTAERKHTPKPKKTKAKNHIKAQLVEKFITTLRLNYKTSDLLVEFFCFLPSKSL